MKSLVIDADTHVFEPLEHFDQYLEEHYKYRSPRVFRDQWGIIRVLMEGRLYPDPSITVYEAHEKLRSPGNARGSGHAHERTHDLGEDGGGHTHGHSHERHEHSEEESLLEGVAMAIGRLGVTDPDAR